MGLLGKKKPQIPALQFYITEALKPDAGIENIKLSHKNCGGGIASISLAKKEEFVSHRGHQGNILETSKGVPLPNNSLGSLFTANQKSYYVGTEPVLTVKCSCGFNENLLLIDGNREALVNLARWVNEKPNAIIVSSSAFYGGEILFGRMKDGKVF
ncbi:MAG: hypothetical protein NTX14_03015 [Candidatus Nealsonbacteria bacterium]|nr:hypothetical protein [Candidatus Nealsonbacteria bacterium]